MKSTVSGPIYCTSCSGPNHLRHEKLLYVCGRLDKGVRPQLRVPFRDIFAGFLHPFRGKILADSRSVMPSRGLHPGEHLENRKACFLHRLQWGWVADVRPELSMPSRVDPLHRNVLKFRNAHYYDVLEWIRPNIVLILNVLGIICKFGQVLELPYFN